MAHRSLMDDDHPPGPKQIFLIRAIAIAVLLAALLIVPARGQSSEPPGLSNDRLALAEIEVRRLAPLLKREAGMTVADVGAGLGAWSLRLSQWLGSSGQVYATDIGEEQLAALRALVTREKLTNIEHHQRYEVIDQLTGPVPWWDGIDAVPIDKNLWAGSSGWAKHA
jgi:hypothetical protein